MFFQIANPYSDNPLFVVNGVGWGYGKMSSRFLYMLPSAFTDEIISLNSKLSEEHIYSEVNDASFFNANLHPPLFTHECIIPGGHQNVREEFQLKVNHLLVRRDVKTEKLQLIDKLSGKQVFVHDSSFQ